MESQKDHVLYYSGYKGEETPRAVYVGGREYPVDEVLWRKRVLDRDSERMMEIFGCKAAGRIVRILSLIHI